MTWTTYGSWLQGDKRKYSKDGEILPPNEELADANSKALTKDAVQLSFNQRRVAEEAIGNKRFNSASKFTHCRFAQNMFTLWRNIFPSQSGLLCSDTRVVPCMRISKNGMQGRISTEKFNKRYCFDENTLQIKINYVNKNHPQE